jgi:type IV secretory pathway VirJ component
MKLIYFLFFIVFLVPLQQTAHAQGADASGLPLHLFPKSGNKPLVVYLTGDGGMNSFSKSLATHLATQGYAVVALDTRKYFWDKKTPEGFGNTAEAFIQKYLNAWNKSSFILVGYSFGADVGAFVPPQLPANLSAKLKSVVMLSPGLSTGFVTKLTNMLGVGGSDNDKYKVMPQLLRSPAPVLCVFGKEEGSDFYTALKPTDKIQKITVPGSHRYNDDVKLITRLITQSR